MKNVWNKDTCFSLVLEALPEFAASLDAYRLTWDGEEPGLCNEFSALGRQVVRLAKARNLERLPALFNAIERLLVEGDDEVQTAASTCFLENLLNLSPGKIDANDFVPLLGPESRELCRGWDKFTGVKTPGLWP